MFGNGRIFISHTHEDIARCQPLLAALDAWQTDYWFDTQELEAGQRFSDHIQQALAQRDIFMHIVAPAAAHSFWMDRELSAARGLARAFPSHPRLIIHLVLAGDTGMPPVPSRPGEIVVNATTNPRAVWLSELRKALGVGARQRVSRRTAIATGVASVAALASTALVAKILLTPAPVAANPFHPRGVPQPVAPEPGALSVRWHYTLDFTAPAENDGSGSVDHYVGLAADSSAVYALSPSSQLLLAFSLQNGGILWVYPDQSSSPRSILTGSTIATPPGSKNIFLLSEVDTEGGSRTYNLICLDKAKATVVWKTPNLTAYDSGGTPLYPQFISNLCLANSQIFFQLENKLYGYSEAGTPLWPPLMIGPSSITPAGPSTSTPVYANGQIFVGTYDGRLLAVNSVTGTITWSAQLNQGQFLYITAAPAVGHGNVYIGGSDGYFYAFSAANGSLIWKSQVVNLATYNQSHFISDYFTVMGAPLVAGSAVFLQVGVNNDWSGTLHGLLCALDAGSGKVLWKVDPTKLALPVRVATPTGIPNFGPWYASGNLVYTTLGILSTGATTASSQAELASAEVLLALNQADGSLHSFFAAPVDGEMLQTGFFPSSPVPVPGGLAFMTNEPAIYVLNV